MMSRPTPRFTRSTIMYKLKPQNMIMNCIVIILYSSRARAHTHARTHARTHTVQPHRKNVTRNAAEVDRLISI